MAFLNTVRKTVHVGNRFLHDFKTLERILVPEDIIKTFNEIVGKDNVKTTESVREQYGKDESHFPNLPAVVVVSPRRTSEVAECAKVCSKNKLPMVPFGTGTGLEGGVLAVKGGVTFDMKNMDHILDLYPEDFCVKVESGVTRVALNTYLRDTGLWFPIDPGADASLCGMCATSASGTNAVQYGTMKDNVLNLEVVLADGRVLHTAGEKMRAKKSSAGYNLTNLFVGSEGTLGIITKAMLKLHGIPEMTIAAVCQFPDIQSAINTTVTVLQTGVRIARIEFLDDVMMKACNSYSHLEYQALPTLFMEFSGQKDCMESQIPIVEEISSMNEGGKISWATDTREKNKLWKARHNALYSALSLRPGGKIYTTDICVPLSKLCEVIVETKVDIDKSGCIGPIVGHVGDGNFHVMFPVQPENEEEIKAVASLAGRMALRAIAAGGTCTGEHGIGLGKKEYLVKEVGDVGVDVMKQLKSVLDPDGLMNPGKVF